MITFRNGIPVPPTPSAQVVKFTTPTPPVPRPRVVKFTTPAPSLPPYRPLVWAYGVTTVPARRDDLLPRTLASLREAGFDRPRLFVDGATHDTASSYQVQYGLEVTSRYPQMGIVGNWLLALWELWVANPKAQRYALFQDDFVCVKGLREYLDRTTTLERVYWNLYTFRWNEATIAGKPPGWYEGALLGSGGVYHGKPQQKGLGAVALVFTTDAVQTLLADPILVGKPHAAQDKTRLMAMDGGIVETMNQRGYREVVHNPSLVQHTGLKSSVGHHRQAQAASFPGEQFDARTLLQLPAGEEKKDMANPTGGPGTELKAILASLGPIPRNCKCNERARQMDVWGVAGCREHREQILAWLRQEKVKLGWLARLNAAVGAVRTGLAFHLDPRDVAGSLLDEAIRRAEAKEKQP